MYDNNNYLDDNVDDVLYVLPGVQVLLPLVVVLEETVVVACSVRLTNGVGAAHLENVGVKTLL